MASDEERLLEFLYACPIGLIECDGKGEIAMINPHAMQLLLPVAAQRDVGNLFAAFEQHAPELRNLVTSFPKQAGRVCENHRIVVDLGKGRIGGQPVVLDCAIIKLGPNRHMVTLSDISRQVAQEERLSQANAWFSTLLDKINNYSVVTITPEGMIVTFDDAFITQLGQNRDELVGRSLAAALGYNTADEILPLRDQMELAARDGWHLQESWQMRLDGERFWCQRLVVARRGGKAEAPVSFRVILRDVPYRDSASDDLRRLLTRDHLTGAANRMHFSQTLERERKRWEQLRHPLGLVVLDLDHFKAVNDTHGHPVGDILLQRVAELCKALLPQRSLFARLGGEEFAVLLPQCRLTDAFRYAELLREAIEALEVMVEGGALKVTASFGCAALDEAAGSTDELIALADRRLYAAKEAGRNRVQPLDIDAVSTAA